MRMQILWSKTMTAKCYNSYFMRTFDSSYEDKGEQKSIHLIGISFIVIHSIFDILLVNVISGLNMHEIFWLLLFYFFQNIDSLLSTAVCNGFLVAKDV